MWRNYHICNKDYTLRTLISYSLSVDYLPMFLSPVEGSQSNVNITIQPSTGCTYMALCTFHLLIMKFMTLTSAVDSW